jgi:hypothetical protein
MERTHDGMVYAALGDSMSIDDDAGGPGRGVASLLWRNRDDDFPAWAGRELTAHDPTARLPAGQRRRHLQYGGGDQLGRLSRQRIIPTLPR